MERIKEMLMDYYQKYPEVLKLAPWSEQYAYGEFPKYWEILSCELSRLPLTLRILEVGCGLGDVTALICGLGFHNIKAYEKSEEIFHAATHKIRLLFKRDNVVCHTAYPPKSAEKCDILIVVNCAYGDFVSNKDEYKALIRNYYDAAGCPQTFYLEVIDSSYTQSDPEFPEYIRLSKEDILSMFPNTFQESWRTYQYPINKRTKTLYKITKV